MSTVAPIDSDCVGRPFTKVLGHKWCAIGLHDPPAKVDACRNGFGPSTEPDDTEVRAAKYVTNVIDTVDSVAQLLEESNTVPGVRLVLPNDAANDIEKSRCNEHIALTRELAIGGGTPNCVDGIVVARQTSAGKVAQVRKLKLHPWRGLPRTDVVIATVAHWELALLAADDFIQQSVVNGTFICARSNGHVAVLRLTRYLA